MSTLPGRRRRRCQAHKGQRAPRHRLGRVGPRLECGRHPIRRILDLVFPQPPQPVGKGRNGGVGGDPARLGTPSLAESGGGGSNSGVYERVGAEACAGSGVGRCRFAHDKERI